MVPAFPGHMGEWYVFETFPLLQEYAILDYCYDLLLPLHSVWNVTLSKPTPFSNQVSLIKTTGCRRHRVEKGGECC